MSSGDLSDKCVTFEKTNLCYYPDEVRKEEADYFAKALSEEGIIVDCKLTILDNTRIIISDMHPADKKVTKLFIRKAANVISKKLMQGQKVKLSIVIGLEGKSSFSATSEIN